jgi:hypothetical protein
VDLTVGVADVAAKPDETGGMTWSYSEPVKTAISVPDETFRRVDAAAGRLGVSRSEFYAKAAERWLAELDGPAITEAINRALAGAPAESEFVRAAAEKLFASDDSA